MEIKVIEIVEIQALTECLHELLTYIISLDYHLLESTTQLVSASVSGESEGKTLPGLFAHGR